MCVCVCVCVCLCVCEGASSLCYSHTPRYLYGECVLLIDTGPWFYRTSYSVNFDDDDDDDNGVCVCVCVCVYLPKCVFV